MALEREISTYERELAALIAGGAAGKFVVIRGDQVVGTFVAYADALQAGYAAAGVQPFLVKRVAEVADVAHFSRELLPCLA